MILNQKNPPDKQDELATTITACKSGLKAVLVFSLCINLLMLAAPLYMLQVFDRVIGSGSTDTLLYLTIITLTAIAALASLEAVRGRVMVKIGVWLEKQLTAPVFSTSVALASNGKHDSSAQGLRDVAVLRNFLTGPALFPIMDAPWLPIFILVIFMLHPVLGLIATAGALILFALAITNDLVSRQAFQQSSSASIKGLKQAEAAMQNSDVVMSMGLKDNLHQRWAKSNGQALDLFADASNSSGILSAVSKFVRLGLQIGMMAAGASLVLAAELTTGGMVAGTILLGRALAPVDQAIGSWKGAIAARGAYARIKALLAAQNSVKETIQLPEPEGYISVENLLYSHTNDLEPVLRGLSFKLQPGEILGVIGPTASGKSTLANLLVGNAIPQAGNVRIDGADIHATNQNDRGNYIGYLPQNVGLFEGTVTENIARMGEYDPQEIVKTAREANVHDIILSLPDGYETNIGEGGAILSGGQRQRIALARALLGNPRLVVLDEPNSSLDFSGDSALIETLRGLKEKKVTSVIITHRPSILRNADKILVLYPKGRFEFGDRDIMLKKTSAPISGTNPTQETVEAGHAHVRPA